MAISAFSEDGKYYSNISNDGRLRLWDTETNVLKQEFTPDLHLTSPPSCLQWIKVGNSADTPQKGGRRKQRINDPETQCIALGTTSGKILIYSVTQAKVDNVLEEKNENEKITSLDWHRRYGLYSSNRAGFVFEWDLQSGSVRNKYNVVIDSKNKEGNSVSAIKIVPHCLLKLLVTASWQVCLWRLLDGDATVLRYLGHNTSPGVLLYTVNLYESVWLVEGSQNERLLSFWDVTVSNDQLPQVNGDGDTPSKKQRKKSITSAIPMYNFVLEDAPKFVNVRLRKEEGGTMLRMAAATRSGVVHYYGNLLNGSSSKPIKPTVTIQTVTPEAVPLQLHCCRLTQDDLLVGYDLGAVMTFKKITLDTSSKTQVVVHEEGKKKSQTNKQNEQTNEVNKVREDGANDVTFVEPLGGVTRKRPKPGAKVEVPMESRLKNLSIDIASRSKSAVNQNLTKLLIQGLHSKDKKIIQMVIQKNDPLVAFRTVSHLPADCVAAFLEQLVDMAARKTSMCSSAVTWASAALRAHAALLAAGASGGANADKLAHLLALFTHRRSHLCQLLNLKGRMELTLAQRSSRQKDTQDQEAILEYNDTSSDEEMEVEKYSSGSERAWDSARNSDDGD